jgi:hypothetical protein
MSGNYKASRKCCKQAISLICPLPQVYEGYRRSHETEIALVFLILSAHTSRNSAQWRFAVKFVMPFSTISTRTTPNAQS